MAAVKDAVYALHVIRRARGNDLLTRNTNLQVEIWRLLAFEMHVASARFEKNVDFIDEETMNNMLKAKI